MTTVNIAAAKVATACQHAMIEAKEKLKAAHATPKPTNIYSMGYWHTKLASCESEVLWLDNMFAAAQHAEGEVTMSVEDVGHIREWL